jgi:hypothetical protein
LLIPQLELILQTGDGVLEFELFLCIRQINTEVEFDGFALEVDFGSESVVLEDQLLYLSYMKGWYFVAVAFEGLHILTGLFDLELEGRWAMGGQWQILWSDIRVLFEAVVDLRHVFTDDCLSINKRRAVHSLLAIDSKITESILNNFYFPYPNL